MSGSIAPSTAARNGFAGTSETSHCAGDCMEFAVAATVPPLDAAPARKARDGRRAHVDARDDRRRHAARRRAPEMPSSTRNTITPRTPMRAIDPPPPDVAMPTIRLETTSGITVMRIAFTKSVPDGFDDGGDSTREVGVEFAEDEDQRRHRRRARGAREW